MIPHRVASQIRENPPSEAVAGGVVHDANGKPDAAHLMDQGGDLVG
jgi:hypothetical protein